MNDEKGIIVVRPEVARELLKLSYKIIDIKARKENRVASLFIFRRERDIEGKIAELSATIR